MGIQNYLKRILELPLLDNSDICEFLSSNVIKDDSQIKVVNYIDSCSWGGGIGIL